MLILIMERLTPRLKSPQWANVWLFCLLYKRSQSVDRPFAVTIMLNQLREKYYG